MRRALVGLGLALAACSSPTPEVEVVRPALTASQLVVTWGSKAEFGTSVVNRAGIAIASDADRAVAVQDALAGRTPLCGTNATCLREAVVGLRIKLCPPTGTCNMAAIGHEVGWVALAARHASEHARMMSYLESINFQAQGLHSTLTLYAEVQSGLRWWMDEALVGGHTSIQIANAAHDRLAVLGAAATSEEHVRLAETRRTIRALEAITARYQADLDAAQVAYGSVATRFKAYRLTETPVFTGLEAIAAQASAAALTGMGALKLELASHSDAENRTPQTLILDARWVRADLADAQARYVAALAPYAAYLAEHSVPVLDHASAPRDGMDRVVAYAEGRLARVNAAVIAIYDGMRRREAALTLATVDAATRQQLRQADAAQREAAFLNDITQRVTAMWKAPPVSALNLPLQSERFTTMSAFLQLVAVCQHIGDIATWRAPGCQKVASETTKITTYLNQTLPFTLRYGVGKMRTAGYQEATLAEIEALVTAGNLVLAVHKYDALLHAAKEG